MPIIKKVHKPELYWILSWNVGEEANVKLASLLGNLDCHFARTVVTIGGYAWEIAGTGWQSLIDASTDEASKICQELTTLTQNVAERLKKVCASPEQAQLLTDKFMTIPDKEYVYFRVNDGKIEIVLTAWGFKKCKKPILVDNRKDIVGKSTSVRLGFVQEGKLLPNHPFAIIRQTVNELQTDGNGYYMLGNKLKTGTVLNLLCRASGEQFQLTVTEGKTDYFFEVNIPEQKIIPQEPIEEQKITLEEKVLLDKERTVIQERIVEVDCVKSEEIQDVKMVGEDVSSSNVIIQLQDKRQKPIVGAEMLLRNHKKDEFSSLTDNSGCIYVPCTFFVNKVKVKVSPRIDNVKVKETKFKYSSSCNFYVIRLKESRNWKFLWWLLLLLLPLLLLIRCEHDIKVTCIDRRTEKPIEGVDVSLDYIAHFLYADGEFFVDRKHSYMQSTGKSGSTVFKKMECSVYSYLFYCLSKVRIVAEEKNIYDGFFHFTRHVVFELDNIDCEVDIVMCIDNTGSMIGLLDMVKSNAMNFHSDLKKYCKRKRRNLNKVRLKVISFGDLREKPITESDMFLIPKEKEEFNAYVRNIVCDGGDDEPENGLEALAMAINTDWMQSDVRNRHIIIVYTDASAHKLDNPLTHTLYYPANMPYNLKELGKRWDRMDGSAKRLVLFAPPYYPWKEIASSWDEVAHKTENLSNVLAGDGYEEILEAICKSL